MKLSILLALSFACSTAAARDVGQITSHSDPKISTWFRTAKSPSGILCCDEADGYREGVSRQNRRWRTHRYFSDVVGRVRRVSSQCRRSHGLAAVSSDLGWTGCPRQPHGRCRCLAGAGKRYRVGVLLFTWAADLRNAGRKIDPTPVGGCRIERLETPHPTMTDASAVIQN